jgi:hypothetical protein
VILFIGLVLRLHKLLNLKVLFRKKVNQKRYKNCQKETNGYRSPRDFVHLSCDAQHRLLYTKRKVNGSKERRILRRVQQAVSYRLLFIYYSVGFSACMTWAAMGRLGLPFALVGMGYVFYRFVRMTWSLDERLTYEREYPVKTITEVYKEFTRDAFLTSMYSVGLTLLMFTVVIVVRLYL